MTLLRVHFDTVPKDDVVEVQGMGLFKNGNDYALDEEDLARWEACHGTPFPAEGVDIPHIVPKTESVLDTPTPELSIPVEIRKEEGPVIVSQGGDL